MQPSKPSRSQRPRPQATEKAAEISVYKRFGASASIGGGVSDFWDYIREPRPHRWTSWGLAVTITGLLVYYLNDGLIPYQQPKRQIIYVESWSADRSDADIRADWVERAKQATRENAARRANYQRIADMLGIDYDSSEADQITRETLGDEADAILYREPPTRRTAAPQSDLAARATARPEPESQPKPAQPAP